MCPHATCVCSCGDTIYMSAYYICHIIFASYYICLILYMPHIIYVSTCYMCVLMSWYYVCVLILHMSSYTMHLSSLHVVILYAPTYYYICVLILLHVWSPLTAYMCSAGRSPWKLQRFACWLRKRRLFRYENTYLVVWVYMCPHVYTARHVSSYYYTCDGPEKDASSGMRKHIC